MSWLTNYKQRRKEKKAAEKILTEYIEKAKSELRSLFSNFVTGMINAFTGRAGFTSIYPKWNKLLEDNVMEFCTEVAGQLIVKSILNNCHLYETKQFRGIFVVVSTIPTTVKEEIPSYLSTGYTRFQEELTAECAFIDGGISFAHWVFCWQPRMNELKLEDVIIDLTFSPPMNYNPKDAVILRAATILFSKEDKREFEKVTGRSLTEYAVIEMK
jgi:hypothetical protein